jgi:predicted phosphate transport protein (TIGR00153 family)
VKLNLIPRERRFYDLFKQQGLLVSETLGELSGGLLSGESRHRRLRELEHACDDVTHEIYKLTNITFTTPIEQEDILLLAHSLDDVVDLAEEVADKIELYKIDSTTDPAKRLGDCLAKAGLELAKALDSLEEFDGIDPILLEIHRLENEGDTITRHALQTLFDTNHRPPADLIKWKDIYSLLESTLDECESVAEIIETIAIKSA